MEDADAATADRDLVVRYYDALDAGDYDALRGLLAPEFVQRRPDRSFESREAFVRFMRDDRPQTDTAHAVDAVYVEAGAGGVFDGAERADPPRGADSERRGDDGGDRAPATGPDEVVVRGRLLDEDGTELVAFVDVFRVEDGELTALYVYTR
jgi:ketosteroid isomerase-like protein